MTDHRPRPPRARRLILRPAWRLCLAIAISTLGPAGPCGAADEVQMRDESIVIPTYGVGDPDPHPMFYTGESYQGAQKRVYPYALQDHLTQERRDRTYRCLTLENEFVRVSVLPEIGGRLFSAVDKTNGYDFFYRQRVIKPALIGMLGAWISGGVEWCAFHHHRSTTFLPVDATLVANPDGSKTIWIGETERRHRMRWSIGLTLRPGRSWLEATVRFVNRTAQPHSILYWANVAVHVNDDYQVIFPPSVQVATYHSKIDFTHWPIARGSYRGHDYSGVDVSWWKNSPVSNSFFAWDLREDFMGGYDHGREAGVIHVGNHHLVCGAKLWEWGTGSYGRAWDRILTDEDGPYAELMVGALSDNQPDYSWIGPHEVKTFRQHWYPVRGIGGFKNANLEGAVNLELADGRAEVGFATTSRRSGARALLTAGETVLLDTRVDVGPGQPFRTSVEAPGSLRARDLRASLLDREGEELIAYRPKDLPRVEKLPAPVEAPPPPGEIGTTEELYLTGLRIEQIHNPKVDPLDYYREAVRRDPGDTRALTMLGTHANRRGEYEAAEEHLRRAIERLTAGYTRPRDAEAFYQLGLALRGQHREAEAYDALYRASWDASLHSAAYFQLAELSVRRGELDRALEQVGRALTTAALDTSAHALLAGILRRLGRLEGAERAASRALSLDPLDTHALNERRLVLRARGQGEEAAEVRRRIDRISRRDVQATLELATDYLGAGMWDEAIEVLRWPIEADVPFASTYPMVHYYLGYCLEQRGDQAAGRECYRAARRLPSDYCFPFRLEGVDVLESALEAEPRDARALYYLGNLLFERQPERAIECWERSREIDGSLAIVHRNLGHAHYRVRRDVAAAIASYERALSCRELHPRLFLELDQLYEVANVEPRKRLAALEPHHAVVVKRQESFLREIEALVLTGRPRDAIRHLEENRFHAQEGREGIHDLWVDANLLAGHEDLRAGRAREALARFQRADEYPENLSVGRPENDPRVPQIAYSQALAHEALGDADAAGLAFRRGAERRRLHRWPVARYYRAACLLRTDRAAEAKTIHEDLERSGRSRLAEREETDFFAKFGEGASARVRIASAHHAVGLGLLGLGRVDEARSELAEAAKMDRSDPWAAYHVSSAP